MQQKFIDRLTITGSQVHFILFTFSFVFSSCYCKIKWEDCCNRRIDKNNNYSLENLLW